MQKSAVVFDFTSKTALTALGVRLADRNTISVCNSETPLSASLTVVGFAKKSFSGGQGHARHDGTKRRLQPRDSPDHRAA
jgi:hypothetical protein